MQVAFILAVVAAFAAAESAPETPAPHGGWLAVVVLLLIAALAAVALAGTRIAGRENSGNVDKLKRRYQLLERSFLIAWIVVTTVVLFLIEWPRLVQFNWRLEGAFLVDELLILAPLIAPWLVAWAAFYDLERKLTAAGDTSRISRGGRWRHVGFCARHHLGLLLAPVVVLLVWQDAVQLTVPTLLNDSYVGLVYAVPLGFIVLMLPLLLRAMWTTEPLSAGPLHEQLSGLARQAGLKARFLVWKTNDRIANAVIAGFTPWLRYVIVSDGMLKLLSPGELSAVVMHEAAHVRRHHLLLRVLVLLPLPGIWLLCRDGLQAMLAIFGYDFTWHSAGMILAMAACAIYCYGVFGWWARLLEHDADLWSCGLLGRPCSASQRADAVANLIAALDKLEPPPRGPSGGWLHPSVDRRIALLRQAETNHGLAARCRRRVNLIAATMIGATAALPVLMALN